MMDHYSPQTAWLLLAGFMVVMLVIVCFRWQSEAHRPRAESCDQGTGY
ncbi:hypothetical protein [Paenibacillus sp. J2TS4]|nr:hypothetical protein [Paenibacillus sp. J2TS4]